MPEISEQCSAQDIFRALVQEQEANDKNAQIACDTIAELSKDKERLAAKNAELVANEQAYKRILGKKSYQEVADELAAYRQKLAESLKRDERMSNEYYMIEKIIDGQAHWWIPDHSESTHWDDPCRWTTDASKARHYGEKWEAEFVMGRQMPGCFTTGHIDCDGPVSEAMTKPDPVVEALECAAYALLHPKSDQRFAYDATQDAIPLARSMAEKLERYERTSKSGESLGGELEYREALEWFVEHIEVVQNAFNCEVYTFRQLPMDCPAVIKKMLEETR